MGGKGNEIVYMYHVYRRVPQDLDVDTPSLVYVFVYISPPGKWANFSSSKLVARSMSTAKASLRRCPTL